MVKQHSAQSSKSSTSPVKAVAPVSQPAPAASKPPKAPEKVRHQDQAKKLPLAKRMTVFVLRSEQRISRLSKVLGQWGTAETKEASSHLADAAESIALARACVERLPEDFKRTGGGSKRILEPNTVVMIAKKRRSFYEGAIEAEDMLHLTIVKVVNNGKTAVCVQRDGIRQMLPTRDLRNIPAAGAEADSEE